MVSTLLNPWVHRYSRTLVSTGYNLANGYSVMASIPWVPPATFRFFRGEIGEIDSGNGLMWRD